MAWRKLTLGLVWAAAIIGWAALFHLQRRRSIDQGMDNGGHRNSIVDRSRILGDGGNPGTVIVGKPKSGFWVFVQPVSPQLIEDVTINGA